MIELNPTMAIRSKSIMVLGSGPTAMSFVRVLGLFYCQSVTFDDVEKCFLNNKKEEDARSFKNKLFNSSILIGVFPDGSRPSQIIHTVFHLRTGFSWEGGFLAIVRNQSERETLLGLSLSGDRGDEYCFEKVPGHEAICMPIFLNDLLSKLQGMTEMYLEQWNTLLSRSSVTRIWENTQKAEKLSHSDNGIKIQPIVGEILEDILKIDWLSLLLDPHRDIKLVNNFARAYPLNTPLSKSDCFKVIKGVQEILSKTRIGLSL